MSAIAVSPPTAPEGPASRAVRAKRLRVPGVVWASVVALAAQAVLVLAGLGVMMWRSLADYGGAAWLNARLGIDPSDPLRVLPVIALWCLCVFAAGLSGFAATQSLRGWAWTRWAALLSALASAATALIGLFPGVAGVAGLVAAALLWTPPARAFFRAWAVRREGRHPEPALACDVAYGPLPRYRSR